MEIQSLSVVVPTHGCICHCKTCVSRIHGHEKAFQNDIEKAVNGDTWHYKEEFRKRLEFARDNGCNTMVLTGAPGEALQNMDFLKKLSSWNNTLRKPFYWIELQTTGVLLDNEENLDTLKKLGVTTISLSNFNIFDDKKNFEVMGISDQLKYDIDLLCVRIKNMGFNLRICLNLLNYYDSDAPLDMFNKIYHRLQCMGADQVTFRELYNTDLDCEINTFIKENRMSDGMFEFIKDKIIKQGTALEVLPFGARKYSLGEISAVIDDDCMSENIHRVFRYLILRENCKLYSKWNDKGSLIF